MDQVGAQWYLFLGKSADGNLSLSSPDYGAWEVEVLEVHDWAKTQKEVISPDAYVGVSGIPDELFVWGQFRIRYFSNLSVEFGARVLDVKGFESLVLKVEHEGQ
jgi:hypothetical protein